MRNLVMLVALAGWSAAVTGYLVQGKLPDAPLLGVPGAIYLALSPTLLRRRARGGDDGEDSS